MHDRKNSSNSKKITKTSIIFFSYETSDGQVKAEEGTIVDRQGENGEPVRVVIVTGAYSYGNTD